MAEVQVYGVWCSAFVRRVEMGLKMKRVEYEYIEEDLKNKSDLLLKYNPIYKKVPVMLHNRNVLVESLIILEYIDEVWEGPPILPKDPYERARARFLAKFIDDKLPSMWKACWSAGEEREKLIVETREALKILENELKGKKFFGGDSIGLVDITANFIAGWFLGLHESVGLQIMTQENFPNLMKWAEEYSGNSFIKENMPDKEKLVAHYKILKTGAQS
ncbi:hypothetical protein ACS0TY_016240 [Phlomoides rotata]